MRHHGEVLSYGGRNASFRLGRDLALFHASKALIRQHAGHDKRLNDCRVLSPT